MRRRPENLIWVMPAEGIVGPTKGQPVVVFAGGRPPHPRAVERVPGGAYVIAADSGLDHARAHDVRVDLVVGDLDSVSDVGIAAAIADGVTIETYPRDKDETDLAIALEAARRTGARDVILISGDGGRLDHLLTGLLLLGADDLTETAIDAWIGAARVRVLREGGELDLDGRLGALVTLVPVGGPAIGVRTEGLRFPLYGETLEAGTTRGVSNEIDGPVAKVSLTKGTLLVIQPEALS
jgi:thiamine pyrophosphokinase